jgi:hypothetical protein
MLVVGFLCNFLVRPVASRWFMSEAEVAAVQSRQAAQGALEGGSFGIGRGGLDAKAVVAWLVVGVPILWGAWITLRSAIVMFQ